MINHDEAQELHLLIGVCFETLSELASEMRRARELAAVIVSDTDPDNKDAGERAS